MEHSHHHTHDHTPSNFNKAFFIGITLNILFVVIEIGYGFLSNSIALLSDAGHNFSDVLSLVFAWGAIGLAKRKSTGRFTYGFKRSTILTALFNAILTFIGVGAIVWAAISRLNHASPIQGKQVIIISFIGIIVNGITAWLFIRGKEKDINIKGAFLHFFADALVSLGVVIAGVLIVYTGWLWIDSLISFVIAAVILYSSWHLFIDAINLALDAAPKNIDLHAVHAYLNSIKEVESVKDLHVWALSTTEAALTVHLIVPGIVDDTFLSNIKKDLHDKFEIHHTTIQVERMSSDEKNCN